jgi:hypothetical protein
MHLLTADIADRGPDRAGRLSSSLELGLLLLRHSPTVVAEAFPGSQLGEDAVDRTLGMLPAGTDTHALIGLLPGRA